MSDFATASRFLRRPRRATEVVLGADGRVVPGTPMASFQMGDPEEMALAGDIVEDARLRADDIVRRAAIEASAIERSAEADGYRAGLEAGTAAARAELAEALALVQRALAVSKTTHDALLRNAEREAVELVVEAARQVIGTAIERDPALVLATVRRALNRAGALNVVRLRVHADDESRVLASLHEEHGLALPFEVAADGVVTIGGCIIDTDAGRIDARLDVQLDQIAVTLLHAAPAVAA